MTSEEDHQGIRTSIQSRIDQANDRKQTEVKGATSMTAAGMKNQRDLVDLTMGIGVIIRDPLASSHDQRQVAIVVVTLVIETIEAVGVDMVIVAAGVAMAIAVATLIVVVVVAIATVVVVVATATAVVVVALVIVAAGVATAIVGQVSVEVEVEGFLLEVEDSAPPTSSSRRTHIRYRSLLTCTN